MESILDAPSARQATYQLSVEHYHQLNEVGLLQNNVELLDGYLIKKMPKSPLHTFICQWLIEALRRVIQAGFVIRQEQPITTVSSEPEPDLSVVRGTSADYREQHPRTAEFVIEVAVNTEEIDSRKAALYAEAGVKEYWIVEPRSKRITVFRCPLGRAYEQSTVFEGAQSVSCATLPGFEVSLPALFK
jgi:Uma2 family endonuclease